jgi:uncharacterized membrane protein YqjE
MPEQSDTPMPDEHQPARRAASAALADVIEMASLRWQLAESELRGDLAAVRRLGLLGGLGMLAAISALPVLTVVLAGQVDAVLANPFPWASLSAGCLLLAGGSLTAWWGWRRFRREFLGLRESLEECREDLMWLREWAEDGS